MSVNVSIITYARVLLYVSPRYMVTTFYLICGVKLQRTQYPPECVMVQIITHIQCHVLPDPVTAVNSALIPEISYKSIDINIFI